MAVPKSERGECKLEVFTKATNLIIYTLQITSNENVFNPKYKYFTDRIVDLSLDIGQNIWEANNVYVKEAKDYLFRKGLQKKAIRDCDSLLYNITIAKRIFHLSGKRVGFWSSSVKEIRDMIVKWKESDIKRFGSLFSTKLA